MQAELPTSTELQAIKNLKQIVREECIVPGTSICGGCGGLEALRLAAKVLGPKTVFVNAAGCFTLLAVFPYTPFKGSWLYTTMASAAAGAQGVRDALDVLMARGKMSTEDDVDVVVNLTFQAEHARVSRAALEAGKHVHSEKPLASSGRIFHRSALKTSRSAGDLESRSAITRI